jgi:PTS system mannose-specific IIC component
MTLTQAFLISLWVFLVQSRVLGYATLSLRFSPLVTGLVVGLILGDVPQALSVSALLQLVYLGVFAPGGPMPAEPCFASATAVSVVLLGNLPPVAGILIAIPVGIYSGKLYTPVSYTHLTLPTN